MSDSVDKRRVKMETVLEQIKDYTKEFQEAFGVPLTHFMEPLFMMLGMASFDIVKFDRYMKRKGYSEGEHGSLKEYIAITYGRRASDFIEELLTLPSDEIINGGKKNVQSKNK